jgi:hypothetical protein
MDDRSIMNEITLSPRERGSHSPTKVTSWWIDGSRERYGEAYFLAPATVVGDSIREEWVLWENHRPYGVNQTVATFDHKPTTWAEIDEAVPGEIVQGLGR